MKNVLSLQNREVLEQFAWSNVLIAFDYDGTLAPIVTDPERAWMRAGTRRLLRDLTKHYPCVVISGRTRADTVERLQKVGVHDVVGNHGLEPWQTSPRFRSEVERWRPLLEEGLSPYKGVRIEDKTYSVAVHYRRSRGKRAARAAILRAAALLGDVRVIGGKRVVNIIPNGAPDKGSALERERERFRCDTAIYVGDDETDEDVFRLDQPGRLLTIRVGAKRESMANYCIRSQQEIDTLMKVLLGLRKGARLRQQRARA